MEQSLQYHIDRYIQGRLTVDELRELSRLMKDPQQKEAFEQMMQESWHSWEKSGLNFEDVTERVEAALRGRIDGGSGTALRAVHRVHFLRTAWFRYAAAIILLAGIGIYYLITTSPSRESLSSRQRQDLTGATPAQDKAILTLADGSQIILDNSSNGNIAQQGNTKIIKLNANQLAYNTGLNPGKEILYNTITTPRGSQYQIVLPDGTKVWLNAASSIKFPTAFTGKERRVEVEGEAYFEVTKNSQQIFFVRTNNHPDIVVIGTSFNVNAYKEDEDFKTSLIEGAVKVNNMLLTPGEAYVNGNLVKTNLEQDIAWKNGLFNFNEVSLKAAMNQLARWYDLDVVYENGVPDITLYSKIYKNTKLTVVLELLRSVGVSCHMEGERRLIISQ